MPARTYLMLLRVLRSAWVWGLTGLLAIPQFLIMLVIRAFDRDPCRRRTGKFLHGCGALITRFVPGWRVSIEGCDPATLKGPFIVVANHQSHTDIPVICRLPFDFKWVAKKELFSVPVAGWMFSLSGEIAVDRKDSRAGAKALIQTVKYIENGFSVVFFPEGTRSGGERLLRFQDGPFRIALKKGIPVLPVVVEGTGKLLPRETMLFTGHKLFRVRMLPPVTTDSGEWEDAGALRDEVHRRMQSALDAMLANDDGVARRSSIGQSLTTA
ncbi:MAG: 1-acyl-sn-glycerol-3-phosphate acyltransferase [Bryobacterales bacterium]|nr:1-acyl-sn-glycerol-3-phosphate acyltransferase [Bryobacterales bacterium]